MIGMTFAMFLTLFVMGFIGAVALHMVFRYSVLAGVDGFLSKWAIGWIGAWLGSPVLGHWGGFIAGVYIIPGLLGAIVAPFVATAGLRALTVAVKPARPEAVAAPTSSQSHVEMRKAS
jgi:uncharacterized membrane protein YeaQ/YmgE (transglycosylase-associated protein family)